MPQSRHRKRKGKSNTRRTQTAGAGLSKRGKIIALVIVVALIVAGAIYVISSSSSSSNKLSSTSPVTLADFDNATTTASGLKYVDVVEGTGASPTTGKSVSVHYTGTLTNGTKFDTSRDNGQPSTFRIGTGAVIKGWDEGLMSMKVGGKRKLFIPPNLAYGEKGRSPIPPNSTLLFDVELVDAK